MVHAAPELMVKDPVSKLLRPKARLRRHVQTSIVFGECPNLRQESRRAKVGQASMLRVPKFRDKPTPLYIREFQEPDNISFDHTPTPFMRMLSTGFRNMCKVW